MYFLLLEAIQKLVSYATAMTCNVTHFDFVLRGNGSVCFRKNYHCFGGTRCFYIYGRTKPIWKDHNLNIHIYENF
jgi:hypothetical protein